MARAHMVCSGATFCGLQEQKQVYQQRAEEERSRVIATDCGACLPCGRNSLAALALESDGVSLGRRRRGGAAASPAQAEGPQSRRRGCGGGAGRRGWRGRRRRGAQARRQEARPPAQDGVHGWRRRGAVAGAERRGVPRGKRGRCSGAARRAGAGGAFAGGPPRGGRRGRRVRRRILSHRAHPRRQQPGETQTCAGLLARACADAQCPASAAHARHHLPPGTLRRRPGAPLARWACTAQLHGC